MKKFSLSLAVAAGLFVGGANAALVDTAEWFGNVNFDAAEAGTTVANLGVAGLTAEDELSAVKVDEAQGNVLDLGATAGVTYTPAAQDSNAKEIDMLVYMIAADSAPAVEAASQTVIYLSEEADGSYVLKAYDATTAAWVALTTPDTVTVTDGFWADITVKIDYDTHVASIYVADVLAGKVGVAADYTTINSLSFSGSGAVDNFAGRCVSYNYPDFNESASDAEAGEASTGAVYGINEQNQLVVTYPTTKTVEGEADAQEIQFIAFKDENGETRVKRVNAEDPSVTIDAANVGTGSMTAYYGSVSAINVYGEGNYGKNPSAVAPAADKSGVDFTVEASSGLYYTPVTIDADGKKTAQQASELIDVADHGKAKTFVVPYPETAGVVRFAIVVSDEKLADAADTEIAE